MNNKDIKNKITVGVTGMHCASCAKIIESSLKKAPGVETISVNPLTEQAEMIYNPNSFNPKEINSLVKKMGYFFNFPEKDDELTNLKNQKTSELKKQKQKLKVSLPITILVLIVIFWNIFVKQELIQANIFAPIVFALSTLILFWIGRGFLRAAGRFFVYGKANMDTLIGIGTGTAYIYSTLILIFPALRETFNLREMFFFDVVIVVITLIYLGKYLESKAKLKTNEVIEKLINLQTKTAIVEKNGQEKEIPLSELKIDNIVIVKPGMKIPADGIIVFGKSAIDEALITGESMPIDKKIGDQVIGTTINKQGVLKVKINKVGKETVLATIIKAIERAQNSKAPIQKLADKVAGVFVPIVLVLAVITLISWLTIAPQYLVWPTVVSLAITSFVSILVIACPCALGLATPTGIMVGLGLASKNGLLIKNASSLEKFGKTKIIVLDKTGTITSGQPTVSDISYNKLNQQEILEIAASLEKNSDHPLAQAIVDSAKEKNIKMKEVKSFSDFPGQGISGEINGKKYWIGNIKLMNELNITLPSDKITELSKQGKTPVILSNGQQILGIIAIADVIKKNAIKAIKHFHKLGIKTIMLSGDHQETAQYIAKQANIDEVIANVSPLEKAKIIKDIKKRGEVTAMVGDGVNDAVALVEADIGIAMADGSDVAIESADITVLHGDLTKIVKALKISRLTMRKIKQNLFWAFFYNIIAIPIAAGALYPTFGLLLNPIIAAGAMSLSSISIVFNTLLMKRVKI